MKPELNDYVNTIPNVRVFQLHLSFAPAYATLAKSMAKLITELAPSPALASPISAVQFLENGSNVMGAIPLQFLTFMPSCTLFL